MLRELPKGIGGLQGLVELNLDKCKVLEGLPNSIGQLSKLTKLSMKECKGITHLPDSIGQCERYALLIVLGQSHVRTEYTIHTRAQLSPFLIHGQLGGTIAPQMFLSSISSRVYR